MERLRRKIETARHSPGQSIDSKQSKKKERMKKGALKMQERWN